MLKKVLLAVGLCLLSSVPCQAEVVAYWNFNTLSIATASAPGSGGVPTTIGATSGAGTLSLTGWTGLVDDFAGSTINAIGADPAEESLSLVSNAGNGSFVQIQTSLTGFINPVITFATRGTASGYNSGVWSWSTDGVNFNNVAGNTGTTNTTFALATVDFSGIGGLANASNAFFRYTLSGATTTTGNNRIDNLQINALTAVPEPSSMLVLGLASACGIVVRRYRGQTKSA